MRFFLAALLVVLSLSLTLRADEAPAPVSVASLLKQETDFSTLPMHRGWRTNLTSSRDPTGGNKDCQQFVSLQGDHAVLADLKGAGAIVRFWSMVVYKNAAGNLTSEPSGHLKIFIDDNPTPVIDEPFTDFFDKHEPFTKPLTDHYGAATISYFPIPYAKHCLVTLDQPQEQFYQIQSLAFPEGTPVRPFALPLTEEEQKALAAVSAVWNEAAKPPVGKGFDMPEQTLKPGELAEAHSPEGPGVVTSLCVFVPDADNQQMRNLILRASFDDHKTPDIEAPIADFFGNAFGHKVFNSFFFSQDGNGTMTSHFPMPYQSHAHFSVENRNDKTIGVILLPEFVPAPFVPGTEYFHADFNQEITKSGRAHAWLKVAKQAGHFVGVVQTMQGNETLGYCEGDGQVRVDEQPWGASQVPTTVVGPWNGTGTEDDFNSAWYFSDGIISRPMNGCLVRQDMGRINCYRFFLNDAPVWQDSIDAQIEVGATNDASGLYYSSVAYWYGPGERVPMEPFPDAAGLVFPIEKFNDRNLAATVMEGESLLPTAHATSGEVTKQEMTGYLNCWSDNAQLAWTGAQKKGDTLDLVINVPKAGDYNLSAYVGHGPDYGAFNVAVAGVERPWNDNAYEPEPMNVRQDWGKATLPAGPCHITIKQMDTDGRSKGKRFGLDCVELFLTKPAKP